ncbi:MAG: hypothetical protein IPM29_22275 [Planctomycetes bacterium]|nr:hypothetical protein [Planctomycetota bacterium]
MNSDPHAALWERAHAALDERRDPRIDPRIAELAADAPEAAAELLALVDTLDTIAAAVDRPPRCTAARSRWPRQVATAAVAALLVAVGLRTVARPEAPDAGHREPAPTRAAAQSATRVLSWSVAVDSIGAGRVKRRDQIGPRGATRELRSVATGRELPATGRVIEFHTSVATSAPPSR